jgi:sugar lactone lactonase YvrE
VAIDGVGDLYIADTQNARIRRVDASGTITTVAGTGVVGLFGDSGPAVSAQLNGPTGVAVDGLGNTYIADAGNNRIRRVDASGTITTLAGTGVYGYSGDSGPATGARLARPESVAVDGLGNTYIADRDNSRVRRVDASGTISTVVGNGPGGFGGDGGVATSARLALPHGVAVDGMGNVYVADALKQWIRRVDVSGTIATVAGAVAPEGMGPLVGARLADARALVVSSAITLFAGGVTGTIQALRPNEEWLEVVTGRYPHTPATSNLARFRDQTFGTVSGVAYDESQGRIYLSESTANRLHVVTIVDLADENTWTIATLANVAGTAGFQDGPADTARFRTLTGLFLHESNGLLYIADTGNHVIRALDLTTSTVTTVVGTPQVLGFHGDDGLATEALLYQPQAITRCGNGDLFIADTGNHRVRRVDSSGLIRTVLGDGVPASSGEGFPSRTFPVHEPLGLACDPFGNLFVTSHDTVRMVAADDSGVVDGEGRVFSIYGAPPRTSFPASVTRCLTGLAVVDETHVQVTDSCTGILLELTRDVLP